MLRVRMLSFLTLMFSLSDGVSTCPAGENPLTLDPPEVTIKYGDEVSVNCTSTVEEHNGMWWCNGVMCGDKEEDNAFILLSKSVSEWDVTPLCKIELNDALECSKQLEITVYKIPDKVNLHPVNAVVEGRNHKLQCDIINVAPVQSFSVKLFKDNEIIRTKSFNKTSKTPVNVSSIFEVNLSRGEDLAEFKCEAQLDIDSEAVVSSKVVSVSVHYAPELINKADYWSVFTVEEGTNITLDCEADSRPPPVYNWTINGKMMDNNNPTLMIPAVHTNATYICTASNYVGNITKHINVYLKRKMTMTTPAASEPQNAVVLKLMPRDLVVEFGKSASINCSTTVKHFAKLSWETPVGNTLEGSHSVTWEVKQLKDWSPGPFCYITLDNDMQYVSEPSITVYKPPDIVSVAPLSEPLVEDTEFTLICDIIDVAPTENLTVTWYRGNETVLMEVFNKTSVTPQNVTSTLKGIAKRSYNGINFTCKAELHLGPNGPELVPTVTSEPRVAVVHFLPTFRQADVSMEIRAGENVTFDCHAEGNPAPEIHWNYTLADNVRETPGGRQRNVSITEATSTNAGVYACVATNKVGNVTRFVTVMIKDPTDGYVPGFYFWHIVLIGVIAAITLILILILIISLCKYYRKHGQYTFVNRDITLTTTSANGKA